MSSHKSQRYITWFKLKQSHSFTSVELWMGSSYDGILKHPLPPLRLWLPFYITRLLWIPLSGARKRQIVPIAFIAVFPTLNYTGYDFPASLCNLSRRNCSSCAGHNLLKQPNGKISFTKGTFTNLSSCSCWLISNTNYVVEYFGFFIPWNCFIWVKQLVKLLL